MPDKKSTFLLFLLLPVLVWSQNARRIDADGQRSFSISDPVTAIAVRTQEYAGEQLVIEMGGVIKELPLNPDAPEFTYFLSLEEPVAEGIIYIDLFSDFKLFLINSGRAPAVDKPEARADQGDCTFEFPAVPQSEWRAGLTPPSYTRSFTDVSHVVVHHAAGSNTNTNYTQVVRDIYILHTEVNGWSDIGYNYLIAQNGTIYAGRDPAAGTQDNVLGAHFCGSNSTTMGICLLGNYETAQPTASTLQSLVRILAFKLQKEDLDPFGTYPHAFGQLGSIVGHRDGCSTACPGDYVYSRLNELKTETLDMLDSCDRSLDFTYNKFLIDAGEEVSFTNASSGYERYKWILEGAAPPIADWKTSGTAQYNLPGVFGVTLIGLTDDSADTLHLPEIITVESNPVVYPNPIASDGTLSIATTEEIKSLNIYTLTGKIHKLNPLSDGSFQLPELAIGIYFIQIETIAGNFTRKLLVQ